MKKLISSPFLPAVISLILLSFPLQSAAQTVVCLDSNVGEFCVELLESDAPVTTQNFLGYVNQGSYRNSFFHLLVTESPFYIQGGRFADLGGGNIDSLVEIFRRPAISPESSVENLRGTLAMVPDDPANPDVVTSQFIINITDNPEFDDPATGTTVFARIIGDGLAVVDAIATLPVITLGSEGLSEVPVLGPEIPAINSVKVIISDATIYDGTVEDFLAENDGTGGSDGDGSGGNGDGSGGDGDGSGGDGGGDTPAPGEGEVLYEDAVCVDTNAGEFCMQLLSDIAPITVENFLTYINSGRYDDTIVHRSVPGFVIQGGGYMANPLGASINKDDAIQNEFNRSNLRGTVAMARLGGVVNSATSEWFINLANNSQLDTVDGGFTVFGQIVLGMEIVDAIAGLPISNQQTTLGSAFGELPLTDQDNDGVGSDDVVLVNRIYVTDVIADEDNAVDDDSGPDVETTAEYSTLTSSFFLPVWIGNDLYRVSMLLDTELPGLAFRVNTSAIVALNDVGQETATMDLESGLLTIPSILVGNKVFTDVVFTLTDFDILAFRLQSYNTE